MQIKETFMWTDSKIALHYLQNEDHNFGVCVSHRVNKILEYNELNELNCISSEYNIADKTSRCQTFNSCP